MNKELHLQYYNSNTLLLVNPKGQIRKLYTPFRVLCLSAVGRITVNTWVYVDEVLSNHKDELLYVIFGEALLYKHFKLPVSF